MNKKDCFIYLTYNTTLNNIQQGGLDALKALKTLYEKVLFLVTVF